MVIEQGIVVEVRAGTALVRTCPTSACQGCAQADACCTFGESGRTVQVGDPLGVQPGQMVRVSVRGSVTALAVALLYGLPVAALVLGTVLGPTVAAVLGLSVSSNVAAAVGAGTLLCCAVAGAHAADRRFRSNPEFAPRITAIVSDVNRTLGENE